MRLEVFGLLAPLLVILPAPVLEAQRAPSTEPYPPEVCEACAGWNEPTPPFRIYGQTYYVGTRGLGAILVASDAGHVLIDGGLPASAPHIMASLEALGLRVEDVRLILNSHAHFDHGGGIAALQAASGAEVAASRESAAMLEAGGNTPGDPQHGVGLSFPASTSVRVFAPGDTLEVGELELVSISTAGHTQGGTSWSWTECEDGVCLDLVYADSLTPVAADGFLYTSNPDYPDAISDFERGFAALEAMRCDILLTPHPDASAFWERVAARDAGEVDALVDGGACAAYAARGREALSARIARETGSP